MPRASRASRCASPALPAAAPTPEPGMDPVLADIFVKEMRGHLGVIRQFLATAKPGTGPHSVEEPLYRACHTLLGSARMAGFEPAMKLAAPLAEHLRRYFESGVGIADAGRRRPARRGRRDRDDGGRPDRGAPLRARRRRAEVARRARVSRAAGRRRGGARSGAGNAARSRAGAASAPPRKRAHSIPRSPRSSPRKRPRSSTTPKPRCKTCGSARISPPSGCCSASCTR